MEFSRCIFGALFLVLSIALSVVHAEPLVPALCIFGDSEVDVGNNNNLPTLVKANFHPYGRDFVDHKATGRFCNGKLAIDFAAYCKTAPVYKLIPKFLETAYKLFNIIQIAGTAEYLGFTSYPPAYLSQEAQGQNILTGVNFASAASGYIDGTAVLYGALTLVSQQLKNYKNWQKKVARSVGRAKANYIFAGAIHLLSTGSSDFVQNYYVNPLLNQFYTPEQFSDTLLKSYSTFIESLYESGARRIGVTSLPPIGCLPAAITLFGMGSDRCVSRLNGDAVMFNNKLNATSQSLKTKLPGLKLVVFDIYRPLLDLITKPSDSGFFESRRACCGTGTLETSYLCNERSLGTCSNATEYVFWDGFHPSESANEKLALSLLEQGFDLIS